MKRLAQVVLVAVVAALGWRQFADRPLGDGGEPGQGVEATGEPLATRSAAGGDVAREAFEQRASGRMLRIRGRVVRILPDDQDGSPHQRFIFATDSDQTLLVAHNLDLAPRLEGLKAGEEVTVYGEYEWNAQGGVMHWTHDDPAGRHVAGYIEWRGRMYQ